MSIPNLSKEDIKNMTDEQKIDLYASLMHIRRMIEQDAMEHNFLLKSKPKREPIRTAKPFPIKA
jgi:hypothetical protein